MGYRLPAWIAPRKRNWGDKKKKRRITRAAEDSKLPCNSGVDPNEYTKENQWAGSVDRDYGELYKKMSLNEEKCTKEAVLFGTFFNLWRKMAYAVSVVFYADNFRLQAGTQLVASGTMLAYQINYWPNARYIDNASRVFNEIVFSFMMIQSAFIKEMGPTVRKFTGGADFGSSVGTLMVATTLAQMAFHTVRLVHNTVLAAKTIKKRR